MCIAIINERWKEDLLSKLDAQFETLASDTLRFIADTVANPKAVLNTIEQPRGPTVSQGPSVAQNWPAPLSATSLQTYNGATQPELDPFSEFLGLDNAEMFWNIYPSQSGFDFLDASGTNMNHFATDVNMAIGWSNTFQG